MKKIKLGIIGIGRIGTNHARIATKLQNAEISGYCDIIHEKVDSVGEKYKVKVFYDYREMLEFVDAVIISVQTEFHFEIAKYFIENGKHVLIEKPITIDIEKGEKLVSFAKKKNMILSVGHVERFNPAVAALSNIFQKDNLVAMSFKRMSPSDYRVKDIDVVLDLMIHDIDIVLNLMKPYEVVDIMAMKNIIKIQSKERNHADYCCAQIKFSNNVIVNLTASRITEKKLRKLYVNEIDKFIEVDYLNKDLAIYKSFTATVGQDSEQNRNTRYEEESIVKRVFVNSSDSLYEEQQNFINAILGIEDIKVTGEDGINALKIAKKIQNKIYSI